MADFGKLNFSVSFNPTSAFPLDARSYFESYAAALSAAGAAEEVGSSESTYYYGQTLAVVESGVATLYVIQPDKTLKPVGSAPVGDGKTIEVVDGRLALMGFGEAEEGQQLRIQNGKIEWFTPDTSTVEGLSGTVAGHTSDINDLKTRVADVEYDIETMNGDGDGSVKKTAEEAAAAAINAWAEELSDDQVVNTFKELVDYVASHGTEAADMAANIQENSNEIEALKQLVGDEDVADQILDAIEEALKTDGVDKYALAAELASAVSRLTVAEGKIGTLETGLTGKVDAVEGSRLMTNAEGEKLEGVEAGAQVNKVDSVSEEFAISGKMLSVKAIDKSKITGLPEALAELQGKIDEVDGKVVEIPTATGQALGLVKGSVAENGVAVAEDGTMTVNSLNVNCLVQTEGDVLILDGGTALN